MLTPAPIVAPRTSPARKPIVTNGAIVVSGSDLHQAVDDDLAVDHVHPSGRDHRVADRDLSDHHRQPVRDPGARGTPRAWSVPCAVQRLTQVLGTVSRASRA